MVTRSISGHRRRWAALAAASTLLLAGCASGAAEEPPSSDTVEKLAITYYEQAIVNFPWFVAGELELWESHGLDLESIPIGDGATGIAAVQSRQADLTIHYSEAIMQANEQGADLRAVVGVVGDNTTDIVVRDDVDIPTLNKFPETIEALSGLTIGVTAVGGYTDVQLRALLTAAGVSANDYTIVGVGLPQVAINSLRAGQIDAYANVEPAGTLAADVVKVGKRVFNFTRDSKIFGDWQLNVYAGDAEVLEERAEAVKRFVAAWSEAVEFIADPANEDQVVEMAATFMKLEEPAARAIVLSNRGSFQPVISEAAVANVSAFMIDNDQLQKPVAFDDFAWK